MSSHDFAEIIPHAAPRTLHPLHDLSSFGCIRLPILDWLRKAGQTFHLRQSWSQSAASSEHLTNACRVQCTATSETVRHVRGIDSVQVYHRNAKRNENRRGFELIKLSGEGGLKPTCKNLNGVSSFAGEPGRPASKDAAMASDRNSRTNNSLSMMRQQHSEAYSLGRSARQTWVDSEMLKKSALPSENPAHYHLLGRVRLRIIGISHQRQSQREMLPFHWKFSTSCAHTFT
jgi:hypothetical protein